MRPGRRRTSNVDLKIVFLGSAFVGKTSVINRYCNQIFSNETRSTVGASFFTHSLRVKDMDVTIMIWDTAGEERFRSVTPSLLRGAHGVVLVFDLSQNDSFADLDLYLDMFLDVCRVEPNRPPPVLLLGNKADLTRRLVAQNFIDSWVARNRIPFYYAVSAKSGEKIEEAMFELVKFLATPDTSMDGTIQIGLTWTDGGKPKCC
jgi:small GTP-binding protein